MPSSSASAPFTSSRTPSGVVRATPVGACANTEARSAEGCSPTTSITSPPPSPALILRDGTDERRSRRHGSVPGRLIGGPRTGAGCTVSEDREATVNEFDLVLPAEVDVREVGMRDGLQLEAPVPLEAKLEMLEALVASGVRRIEATSFVSPKAVPALADADRVAAELG